MTPDKVVERLEVLRDCYQMFFDNESGGVGFEAKYRENKEAFDIAVKAVRIISKLPPDAVLIDRDELHNAVMFHTYSVNVTDEVNKAIGEVLKMIREAEVIFGGDGNEIR